LQLRLKEDVSDKIHIFGAKNFSPLMLKRTSATAGAHIDLHFPVSDVDKKSASQANPEEANKKSDCPWHCGKKWKKVSNHFCDGH
jgi:hypothetical protein